MGDDRPIRYTEPMEDGRTRVVYRASSVGGCERAFVAAARGMAKRPHPEWFQDVLDEGTNAEQSIIDMYLESGGDMVEGSEQDELELVIMDDEDVVIVVRAHADGRTPDGVLECKKFRDSTWPRWKSVGCEVNANYPWQVATYLHALHQQGMDDAVVTMVGGRFDVERGEVVEIDLRFYNNPPIPLRAFKQKIARIERLIEEGFDPTDADVKCEEKQYPCGYWYLHPSALAGGKDKPVPVKIRNVPENIKGLLAADVSYKTQLKMIEDDTKKIKARRDANRVEIMAWMAENGVKPGGSAVADGYAIDHVRREVKGYEVKPRTDEYLTVKFEKVFKNEKKASADATTGDDE
jgi:hypothetical protein